MRVLILAALIALILAGCAGWVRVAPIERPIARASDGNVTIALSAEPCDLGAIANLPYRATWTERGSVTAGCWGSEGSIVIMYWADRTIVLLPVQRFLPQSTL